MHKEKEDYFLFADIIRPLSIFLLQTGITIMQVNYAHKKYIYFTKLNRLKNIIVKLK